MLYHQGLQRPSLQQGIATSPGESQYPELWNELVGMWAPSVGHQGITTLLDFSINKNHGTFQGSMTNADWIIGNNGYALDFDGTDDRINIGNPSTLQLTSKITITAWYKTTSSASSTILSKFYPSGTQRSYKLRINSGTVDVIISSNGSTNAVTLTDTVSTNDGQWHFAAMTNEGTGAANSVKLYVDGRLITGTGTSTIFNSTASVQIGRQDDASNPTQFTGSIGDVLMYSRSLTFNERNLIYQGASPLQLKRQVVGKAAAVAGSLIKTFVGLAYASTKTINGLAIGSLKSKNGLQ